MTESTLQQAGVPYPLGHGQVGITTQIGKQVCIRHVTPQDAPLLAKMFGGLSLQTRWLRFFNAVGIPQERLWDEATRLSDIDPRIEAALIATVEQDGETRVVAMAQMIRDESLADVAEVAIVVSDDYQCQGIGRTIFDLLVQIALVQGIKRLWALTLPENLGMQRLARGVGLPVTTHTSEGEMIITIYLQEAP
jgi:acetyltransferase